jgi:hypothetical protein
MFDFDVVTGPGPIKPKESRIPPTAITPPPPGSPDRRSPAGVASSGAETDGRSFRGGDGSVNLPG